MSAKRKTDIALARVYDDEGKNDGYRVLVDRIWPRGIRKEALDLDEWCKDVAPSSDLRKWFGHDPKRFDEFRDRYLEELDSSDEPQALLERAGDAARITLLIAAKDESHNHGIVLRDHLKSLV